jgi:hypothetical protein
MNNAATTSPTPEQRQLAIQLESIFMPSARARRDGIYNGQAQSRFVHYTSADAALSIIGSKRIWMRNTTCMSDYREVQHGFELLNAYFRDTARKAHFITALDECSTNVGTDAIALFNQWWADIQHNTYVASVSEHDPKEDLHGRLSMWRAFGGNAARVAIVFNIPWFTGASQALNLTFNPVAYFREEDALVEITTVIKNVRENTALLRSVDRQVLLAYTFLMLVTAVTCVKHEGFQEEREWRVIYAPTRAPSPFMEQSTEAIGGVPQIVHKIPLDDRVSQAIAGLDFGRIFDRVIIGPSQYSLAMYQAFVAALTTAGVTDASKRVLISGIPIRS